MPNSITFFCGKFYNSPSVLDMPFKIRSLYKYTILNPSRSCSGVYPLPISKICFETGLNRKEVESGLKQLESKYKKIFYEFDSQLIFVFTVFKFMPKTKQIIIAAKNDFKFNSVTDRFLKKFLNLYPGFVDGHVMVTQPSFTDTGNTDTGNTDTGNTDTEKNIIMPMLENLKNLYNENRGENPEVISLSTKRKERCKARLKEKPDLKYWKQVFQKAKESDLLQGKNPSPNYPNFRGDFDWIIKNDNNHVKIFEGKYNNQPKPKKAEYLLPSEME